MKNAPFQPDKLNHVPGAKSPYIFRHSDNKDIVVRGSGEFGYEEGDPIKKKEAVYEGLLKAKKLFTELSNDYGIQTAGFRPIIANYREKQIGAVIVSDWVDGKNYIHPRDISTPEIPVAKKLLETLTAYLTDKHDRGEEFLSDIGSIEQYVYNAETQSLVLVDMDPYIGDGYLAESVMLSNMSNWASKVLSPEEFDAWHSTTMEAIKPVPAELHA